MNLSDRLADNYRTQSAASAEKTAAAIRGLWYRHMPYGATVTEGYEAWIKPATQVLIKGRAEQAAFARTYYRAMRRLELPGSASHMVQPLPPTDPEVVRSSLYFIAFLDGRPPGEKLDDIPMEHLMRPEQMSLISGSVVRHAMNGGRHQIKTAIDNDPADFKGYYRQLGADPCGFCALLGTRHDYGAGSFDESDARFEGPGEAKVHDACHCTMRPYFVQPALSPMHHQAEDMWKGVNADLGPKVDNKTKINEFSKRWRKAKEAAEVSATLEPDDGAEGLVA